MKLFGRTWEIKNSVSALPQTNNDEAWRNYLSGKGYLVSAETAIKVAAVIRCVDVVAKTMASLPLRLYRKTDTGSEKAEDHPIYSLINRLPNPDTTAYEFWHMYIFNLMLSRGAYAKVVRDRGGFIRAIWNIPTCNVDDHRNETTGEKYITVYTSTGERENLYPGYFMHTPGLRFFSATTPEDPVQIASDVLGLTMALSGFAKDFFENGANIGGVLETPSELSEAAYQRMKADWQTAYAGIMNQHKTAILEQGTKLNKIEAKLSDAQALESRKFQIVEICRMLGVPPHKVFDLDRATFSNIEQQNIEYVQESIAPMSVRLEQTIYKDLLLPSERLALYAKFTVNALLRGDMAARTAYFHNARQDGWMNGDEIRELEDMNRIADGSGQYYAVNGNMIPLSSIPQNLPKGAAK